MARSLEILDIASPCTRDWKAMVGDDKSRLCAECEKNVYDLSAMTRDEALDLIDRNEGKMCVRFIRRADGTVVTSECAPDLFDVDPGPGTEDVEMLMGEIDMPDPEPVVSEPALDRDLVLAEVRRSLEHTHPERAELLMREVERLVIRIVGTAACPHCSSPLCVSESEEVN